MVEECQFHYADGRHCRRIPKRGETFCRDHRRCSAPLRRALPAPGYASGYVSRLAPETVPAADPRAALRPALPPLGGLGLDELLRDLLDSLQALEPLALSSASSAELVRYERAATAAEFAIDRLAGQQIMIRHTLRHWPAERLAVFCRILMLAGRGTVV
jgi:hypothetical protein